MTTYVNGRFLTQRPSGMQRWAEEMLVALDARLASHHSDAPFGPVVILRPQGAARQPNFSKIEVRTVGSLSGHLWEQLELGKASHGGTLLNLLSSGPLTHPRMVSTFHDAAVMRHPELFSRSYRTLHRTLRPLLARRSKRLLTVSSFSARELSSFLNVPQARFSIAPNASSHIGNVAAEPAVLDNYGLVRGGYGLCVGNQTPNKNIATAIAAMERLARPGLKLALVGAGDARVFGGLSLDNHPFVTPLGFVGDGALRALYENAAFLCFPSRYEGFGIPVLEAMTLGCPVIASDASAVLETAGGAAIHCAPNDVTAFAEAMSLVLDTPSTAADLRSRGLKRAKAFSWDRSAAVLEGVLSEITNGREL